MDEANMKMNKKRSGAYDLIARGILSYRRMVKKKDLVQVFYIYICLCHVCPAHPCGENPLAEVMYYSEINGLNLSYLLSKLQRVNNALYSRLMDNYRSYSDCIGMVETGYIKRSFDAEQDDYRPLLSNIPQQSNIKDSFSIDSDQESPFNSEEQQNRRNLLRSTQLLLEKALMPLLDEEKKRKKL